MCRWIVTYPGERLNYMIQDAGMTVLLTEQACTGGHTGFKDRGRFGGDLPGSRLGAGQSRKRGQSAAFGDCRNPGLHDVYVGLDGSTEGRRYSAAGSQPLGFGNQLRPFW